MGMRQSSLHCNKTIAEGKMREADCIATQYDDVGLANLEGGSLPYKSGATIYPLPLREAYGRADTMEPVDSICSSSFHESLPGLYQISWFANTFAGTPFLPAYSSWTTH